MTAHTFFHTSEFVGPGTSTIEVHLEIRFEHSKADPDVGAPESVSIEHIRFDIGDAAGNGKPVEETGAADGKHFAAEHALSVNIAPIAGAIADRQIQLLIGKTAERVGGNQA